MGDGKRMKDYDDLPLVLDVRHIQGIMGISRTSAYELMHTPGFSGIPERQADQSQQESIF